MHRDIKLIINTIRKTGTKIADEAGYLKEDEIERRAAYENAEAFRALAHELEVAFVERDNPEAKAAHEARTGCLVPWCPQCNNHPADIPEDGDEVKAVESDAEFEAHVEGQACGNTRCPKCNTYPYYGD